MPIHDQGYRRYGGSRRLPGRTWWVIARMHIAGALKSRRFGALLLFSWAPFVVQAVGLFASASLPMGSVLATTTKTFRDFFDYQSFFVFVITIALSGLIADDRRANALPLYLSKPLTRLDYVVGKLAVVLLFLLGVTFVPAMLLVALSVAFAGSTAFLRENLFLLPAITLFSALQALFAASAILAVSSLTKSRRFASIMYAGILFFTAPMYQALRAMTGSRAWAVVSPGETLDVIADAVFRVPGQPAVPVPAALAVVLMLIGASMAILWRRVRAVDVVG